MKSLIGMACASVLLYIGTLLSHSFYNLFIIISIIGYAIFGFSLGWLIVEIKHIKLIDTADWVFNIFLAFISIFSFIFAISLIYGLLSNTYYVVWKVFYDILLCVPILVGYIEARDHFMKIETAKNPKQRSKRK